MQTLQTENKETYCYYVALMRKKYKLIPDKNVYIIRNTPVGEDADFYERKPFNGKLKFYPVLEIEHGKIVTCYNKCYNYDAKQWECKVSKSLFTFLEYCGITIPAKTDEGTALILTNED